MILEAGEKVHVIERRYFTEDLRRHFTGQVIKCTEQAVRLRGYAWVFDKVEGQFVMKPEERERIICFGDRMVINVIPKEVNLEEIQYVTLPEEGLVVTDGKDFMLEITEFTAMR